MSNLNEKETKMFQVEEIDTFQFDENGNQEDWKGYGVTLKEDPVNYCWLCRDKVEADNLCEFLNDNITHDTSIEDFVLDNCIEWSNLISELSRKEIELYKKKEDYEAASEKILEDAAREKAENDNDIIKAKYGGNNDKTRKKYVKDSLAKEKQEIKTL